MTRHRPVALVSTGLVVGLLLGALGYAAARPAAPASATLKVCVKGGVVVAPKANGSCPANASKRSINVKGPRGPRGPRGEAAPTTTVDITLPYAPIEQEATVVAPGINVKCYDSTDPLLFARLADPAVDSVIGSYVRDRSGGNPDDVYAWTDGLLTAGGAEEVWLDLVVVGADGRHRRVELVGTSDDAASTCHVTGSITRAL